MCVIVTTIVFKCSSIQCHDLYPAPRLGSCYFARGRPVFKYLSIKCPPYIPFMRIMAHLRVQSFAELYVGFPIRLELLAGFIFARV